MKKLIMFSIFAACCVTMAQGITLSQYGQLEKQNPQASASMEAFKARIAMKIPTQDTNRFIIITEPTREQMALREKMKQQMSVELKARGATREQIQETLSGGWHPDKQDMMATDYVKSSINTLAKLQNCRADQLAQILRTISIPSDIEIELSQLSEDAQNCLTK